MPTHQSILLNQQYELSIKHKANVVRLAIVKDSIELVCRKEKASVLNKFLLQTTAHLFKGRLQLDKNNDMVVIVVKGEIIGTAEVAALADLLKHYSSIN